MAAKTNRHRYGEKNYVSVSLCIDAAVSQFEQMSYSCKPTMTSFTNQKHTKRRPIATPPDRTEPVPWTACTEMLVEYGHVFPEIFERKTDRQKDTLIAILRSPFVSGK